MAQVKFWDWLGSTGRPPISGEEAKKDFMLMWDWEGTSDPSKTQDDFWAWLLQQPEHRDYASQRMKKVLSAGFTLPEKVLRHMPKDDS